MIKIKKAQLKKIIKECILELSKEGSLNDIVIENKNHSSSSQTMINERNHNNNNKQTTANTRLKEIANTTAQYVSMGNPKKSKIMAAIFEDTANTTLQQTLYNEGHGSNMFLGEQVNQEQIKVEQEQLEALAGGNNVKRWATVAFGKK